MNETPRPSREPRFEEAPTLPMPMGWIRQMVHVKEAVDPAFRRRRARRLFFAAKRPSAT